jgi:predicted O-methyltransferase YrrM
MARTRSISSLARNLLRPGYARVIVGKVRSRFTDDARTAAEALDWYAQRRVRPVDYFAAIDPALADETARFGESVRARAAEVSAQVGFEVDSAGRYELLYFLTRLHRPRTIVETGVAYGYSSLAFLRALERNGDGGRLWSSDFPFFRMADPERFVGIMVPDELRDSWSLRTKGDGANLPEILTEVDRIDLFHYDSDKSARGREFGCDLVLPRLASDGVFLMDDIQDNGWFKHHVERRGLECVVFGGSNRAFVGAVGVAAPE